jgi:hypothetical protein
MIKVNLVGIGRKKPVKTGSKIGLPASFTPILLLLIILGFAGGGYKWFSDLTAQNADLDSQIQGLEARKTSL